MWVLCALVAVAVVVWKVTYTRQTPRGKRKLSDTTTEIHDVELGNAPPPEPPLRERRKPIML